MGNKQIDSQKSLVENRLVQYTDFVELTYADGNTAISTAKRKLIGWIPAKSIILDCLVLKLTNFNAAGNDYLAVGTHDDDDLFVDDLDISTAAATAPILMEGEADTDLLPYYTSTEIAVYASYVYSSTAPTTGKVQVALMWVPWTERELDIGAIVT